MTHEQIERMLTLLDSIDNSLAVMADYTEKTALCFEATTQEESESDGKRYIRVVDIR